MRRWFYPLCPQWILWLLGGFIFAAVCSAQTELAQIPSTHGDWLTFSFYPGRKVYELRPFNIPRYKILANDAGQLKIFIRGIFLQDDEPRESRINMGPVTRLQVRPQPGGMLLIADWEQPPIVEHTRRSIRFMFDEARPSTLIGPTSNVADSSMEEASVLRPGDQLVIFVFWETGSMRRDEVTVESDKTIQYRELGKMTVAGLPLGLLRQHLEQRLQPYLRRFSVAIHHRRHPVPYITVVGELRRIAAAGEYKWHPKLKLIQLLRRLGGWGSQADLNRIALYRIVESDYERHIVNLETLLAQDLDLNLSAGDVVYLPAKQQSSEATEVAVFGMVNSPGLQPFRSGQSLADVIRTAGGSTIPDHTGLRVSVLRQDGQRLSFTYSQSLQDETLTLKEGDVVYVHTYVPRK